MASIEIPPWLRIDPVEPVNKMLAGYGQGRAAGAGRLSAEEHEIDREYNATQRAEALAAQREQAAAMMAYRQQAAEEQSRQFDERQRIRQRQAEIAAEEASIQLEGQRGFDQDFQSLIERGLSPTQAMKEAFPRHASKMLYKSQWRVPDAVRGSQGPMPPVFGTSPGGAEFAQDQRTGNMHFTPGGAKFTPRKIDVDGTELLQVGPNQYREPRRDTEGTLPPIQRARLSELNRTERRLLGALHGLSEEEVASDPEFSKTLEQVEALRDERESIFAGEWKPPAKKGASPGPAQEQRKAAIADREEAVALMTKFPKKADAIRARFKEVFGEDL